MLVMNSNRETHLVGQLCLLHLILMKTLNTILDNLSSLLDSLRERVEWLLELCFHLTGDRGVSLRNGLGFPADHVQRSTERS